MKASSHWDWVFVVVFAFAIFYQVLVAPLVGLPNNGDFPRMMNSVGLTIGDDGRDSGFTCFNRYYTWDFSTRDRPFPSSELAFVVAGLALNSVISKSGLFDITAMGTVHGLAYLLVIALIAYCGYRNRHPYRWVVYIAILTLFSDVTYVAYFNSLYAEPAALIFLGASLGFGLLCTLEIRSDRNGYLAAVGFLICSLLFLSAKLQNAILGPLLAVGLLVICRLLTKTSLQKSMRAWRLGILGVTLLIGLSFAYWIIYSIFPMGIRNVNVYDSVFFEIVKNSTTPQADLDALGLDKSYLKYKGTHAWSPGVTKEIYNDVYKRVGEKRIMFFYITHPRRLMNVLNRSAKHAFDTRPGYLGNFDCYAISKIVDRQKSRPLHSGESYAAESTSYLRLPAPYFSHSFAFSSGFKQRYLVGSSWPLFAFLVINLTAIFIKWRYFDFASDARVITGFHASLVLIALLQFLTCTIGAGELDLVKHLFLFDVVCDICIVFLVGYFTCLVSMKIDKRHKLSAHTDSNHVEKGKLATPLV